MEGVGRWRGQGVGQRKRSGNGENEAGGVPIVGAYGQGVALRTTDGAPVSRLVLEYALDDGGLVQCVWDHGDGEETHLLVCR